MTSDLEESIKTNILFYKRVVKTIDGAKSIQSEVGTEEEYGGGPSDDVVFERIHFNNIGEELNELLQEIEKNDGIDGYTKRESLTEIVNYCDLVLGKEALSKEHLTQYSSQENPTIWTADNFLDYQQSIKTIYEKTQKWLKEKKVRNSQ